MEKFLAGLFLVSTGFAINLGNFWFTYGIWPHSWPSFVTFWILGLVNYMLLGKLAERNKGKA